MSFGFGVGDFIAVLDLISRVRKGFLNSPSQFRGIEPEVKNLSLVLLEVEVQSGQLTDQEKVWVDGIVQDCKRALQDLEKILVKFKALGSEAKGPWDAAKKVTKRLQWDPQEAKEIQDRISRYIGLLNTIQGQVTQKGVVKIVQYQESKERQEVLDWISSTDHVARQKDLLTRLQPNSRRWLFESAEYSTWMKAKGQVLFCSGMPGAGKTYTTTIVVDSLRQNPAEKNIMVCYVYCSYKTQQEQPVEKMLRDLLRNILQQVPEVPSEILTLYSASKSSEKDLSREDVFRLLKSTLSGFDRTFIAIDALDELVMDVRGPFLKQLQLLQAQCSGSSSPNLFITSRPGPVIQKYLPGAVEIEILASDEDVGAFLKDNAGLLPDYVQNTPGLQKEVFDGITKACNGMFLLAELHLRSLQGLRMRNLRKALVNLATGSSAYDCAYQDAMDRIKNQPGDSYDLAKDALRLITFARRPLLTTELCHALRVDIRESPPAYDELNIVPIDDVQAVCAGLVTVDQETGVTRLVHKSAQEYFDRNQSRWFPGAHAILETVCLAYLSAAETEADPSRSFAFHHYADANWAYHHNEAFPAQAPETSSSVAGEMGVSLPANSSLAFQAAS